MAPKEQTAWLTLLRAPGIGAKTLNDLLDHFGSAQDIVQFHQDARLPDALKVWLANPDHEQIERDLAWLKKEACQLLPITHSHFPPQLLNLPDPPVALFVRGDVELLAMPQLAIVGSRSPTPNGADLAHDFAAQMAKQGFVITSGMALGIDGSAHQGALDAKGSTIAVAGTGLDRVYPAKHRDLAREIAKTGALVSEFLPGTPVRPGHFPKRNRIISGLSLGTLVIEAALDSGSLITARLAVEQGREVFAIPGSVHNPLARGCHALIRQGAKLVESVEHILEEFGPLLSAAEAPVASLPVTQEMAEIDEDHRLVMEKLGYDPISADALVLRTGLPAAQVSSILLLLELQGHVSSSPGGLYARSGVRRP